MPKLVLMLPETTESVTRPVVFDVVRELFKRTGINPNTRIYYPGDLEATPQPGSVLGQEDQLPNTSHNDKITVEVDEQFDQNEVLSAAVFQPENLYVYRDDAIAAHLKPAYAGSEVTINFTGRFASRTEALRWRDALKTRVTMGRTEFFHAIKYHFMIPEVAIAVVQELHRMREAVAGYGEDWPTYWRANTSRRVDQISNLSGQQKVWAVSESQLRVLGFFDFEHSPERGGRQGDADAWTIGFSYKFRYSRPVACVLNYPLVVHNQVVNKNFRPAKSDRPERSEHHLSSYSLSARDFGAFEEGRWTTNNAVTAPGIALPDFDEFIPNGVIPRTLRVVTALCLVDPAQPRLLLDLNDLGPSWKLDADILAYMRKIHSKLHVPFATPLVVSLYSGPDLIAPTSILVDENLRVLATADLPLRNPYHVRLGLSTNWRGLQRSSLDILREDGVATLKLLSAIDSRVTLRTLSTGYVPQTELERALDVVDNWELAQGNGQIYQFNTVMSLFVSANRRTD